MKHHTLIFSILACCFVIACAPAEKPAPAPVEEPKPAAQVSDDGYLILYNGVNLDGWKPMVRTGDEELARQVFTPGEDGALHIYKDLPDGYQLNEGINDTHGVILTEQSFSRYSFKFEYKWGMKRLNNYDQFQYDSGVWYHVYAEKVWPNGFQFQLRYNDIENVNHTGDLVNGGVEFQWYEDPDGKFLPPWEGGVQRPQEGLFHWARDIGSDFHGLDDEWNEVELIVMGDEYALQKVNGHLVNMATDLSMSEGPVGFQAETAEIYLRNIRIKEFDESIPLENFR